MMTRIQLCFYLAFLTVVARTSSSSLEKESIPWIVNVPHDWHGKVSHHRHHLHDTDNITKFDEFIKNQLIALPDISSDGENVDVLEHFFYGKTHGVALVIIFMYSFYI